MDKCQDCQELECEIQGGCIHTQVTEQEKIIISSCDSSIGLGSILEIWINTKDYLNAEGVIEPKYNEGEPYFIDVEGTNYPILDWRRVKEIKC